MVAMSARSLSLLFAAPLIIACGDDGNSPADAQPDAVDYTIGDHPALAMACADSVADVYTLPAGLPAMDDTRRGDVVRCAKSEKLTVPEIKAQITAYNTNYMNTTEGTINSGFWTYRITYRTQRNTVNTARAEGDAVAVVLLPAKPLDGAPLVVFGHGSVGFAPKCAPSHLDLGAAVADEDFPPMLYRLAGYGFTVISTDYSGFSFGQEPGYFNAEDEAHAVLDATRAAAKLLPSPPAKVALIGHSQGGHAVLAAQSYAKSYGLSGQLVGVATLAPFWSSLSLFATATTAAAQLKTATDVGSILYSMTYLYAAGELREPGTGLNVFQTAKQAAAKEVINGAECYDAAKMQALGAAPADFFDPTFVQDVGYLCATNLAGSDCTSALGLKWKPRFQEDRPAIDAMSAPITLFFGGMDTFVPPSRAACARNKINADLGTGATTQVQYCYDSKATHRSMVRAAPMDYLVQWIAAKGGAGTEPAACTPFSMNETCSVPPHEL